MAWSQVPVYAELTEDNEINYLCTLRDYKEYNVKYIQDKQTIMLRNCDENGIVLDIALSETKLSDKPWVLLTLRKFNIDGFGIFLPNCSKCSPELKQISSIQQKIRMPNTRFLHSFEITLQDICLVFLFTYQPFSHFIW